MKLRVKVTPDCIEGAVRKDSHRCMIADAIHKSNKHVHYVIVDLQSIKFTDSSKKVRYTCFTPPLAQSRLLDFDHGKTVKPFAFTAHSVVEKPSGWQAQRNPTASRKGRKYPGVHKRKPYASRRIRQFGIRMFSEAK